MHELNTVQDLIHALRSMPAAADPMSDLARHGYKLSPALDSQWKAALAAKKTSPRPGPTLPTTLRGKQTFQAQPFVAPAPPPPAGTYDVVAGISLSGADLALSALYQSGTIPNEIDSPDLNALAGAFIVDKPGGLIDRAHITGAPTLAPLADGSGEIALRIPLQLDWAVVRSFTGRRIRTLITTATGTLQLTLKLSSKVSNYPPPAPSTLSISINLNPDVSAADSPRLTLDPQSPVRLTTVVPPNQIDGIALLIQGEIGKQIPNGFNFTISPDFQLPIGDLWVGQADVVATGGALVAGVNVLRPDAIPGNKATLKNLLPSLQLGTSNVFVQMQQAPLSLLIKKALDSGYLTAQAKQQFDNAAVDSASAVFQDNAIVVQVNARLVDECPAWVDLGVILTRTITFDFKGSEIDVNHSDDKSIAEWSNVWCLLTSLGLIGLGVLLGGIFGGWGMLLGGLLGFVLTGVGPFLLDQATSGGGGTPKPDVVALDQPIPGTDFLPTISGGDFLVTNGAMLMGAIVGIAADNLETVMYVRFVIPEGISIFTTQPVAGVKVELMDQDVPAPAGDDVPPVVVPRNTQSIHNETIISTKYSYEPPTADQKLAEGKTDANGVVKFAMLNGAFTSSAGNIKSVHTVDSPQGTTTTVTHSPVLERKPDLYFRLTMADMTVVDTRKFAGGFMENFSGTRVGTLANPMTITLGPTVGGNAPG